MNVQNLHRARQLYDQARYSQSYELVSEYLSFDPQNNEANIIYVLCQIELGMLKDAGNKIEELIAFDPEYDYLFYIKALVCIRKENYDEAILAMNTAITLAPESAVYFALKAEILKVQKKFDEALKAVEVGLTLDPTDNSCLEVKAEILSQTGDFEKAESEFREALEMNPEDADLHAGLGFNHLRNGDHKKAMEYFYEALQIDPNNHTAIQGMKEAMKSKFFLYRWFLQYTFWMSRQSGRFQWFFIIGLYLIYRYVLKLSRTDPEMAVYLNPLIYLYIGFVLTSWLMTPLSNLILRLDKLGKHALTKVEKSVSEIIGVLILFAIIFLSIQNYLPEGVGIFGALYCGLLCPAIAGIGSLEYSPKKKNAQYVAIGLGVIGFIALLSSGLSGTWGALNTVFIFGAILSQFYINHLAIKS